MKNLIDFLTPKKQSKYTCACCGYQSLPSNNMGEICPICFWEKEYGSADNLFDMSDANYLSLYQGQENYKKFGCCRQKFSHRCRKPNHNEINDIKWVSIQEKIEKDNDLSSSLKKIDHLSEQLKQPDAKAIFENFKNLPDVELDHYEFGETIPNIGNQLFLKSLLIHVSKKDINLMKELFSKYYKKGIQYYTSWLIMFLVLTEINNFKLNVALTDLLFDIENNNYYGLTSLEKALKKFWREQKNLG